MNDKVFEIKNKADFLPHKTIALIINNFNMGGAEQTVISLINSFDFYDFIIICKEKGVLFDKIEKKRIREVHILTGKSISSDMVKVYSILKDKSVALVWSNLEYPNRFLLISAFLRRLPRVASVYSIVHPYSFPALVFATISYFYIPTAIVFVSQTAKENFPMLLKRKRKYEVIYSFPILSKPIKLISKPDSFNVFTVLSRIEKVKNLEFLLNSFIILRDKYKCDFKLNIIGKGSELNTLKNFIAANNLQDSVQILGFVNDPSDYLLNSSYYILPSIREGMPLSLIEAQSYGLPCIVSDIPALKEFVKEGKNGFIGSIDNPGIFVETLFKAINIKRNEWEKLSHYSILFSSEYSLESSKLKYLNLFNRLIGDTRNLKR